MATSRSTYVHVWLDGGYVPAGQLVMVEDGRASFARFRYGNLYVERPGAFAVDPVQLPLSRVEVTTPENFVLFNGVRDAAPDGWGRHLMDRAAGAVPLGEFDYLVASGDDRVGALAFGPDLKGPRRVAPWLTGEVAGERLDLPAMIDAAQRLDQAAELDESLRRFLVRGSSALGGARPKATTERDGAWWIAKFGRRDDRYDICKAEFAVMTLAKRCGLRVPRVSVERVFNHDIYLVQRFDRVNGGRVPFISGLTLLGAHESDRGRSYAELAAALRQHGSSPKADLIELFRRMVFNILVNNTDDHLKNHGFLFDGRGWRLSPAYDLVPFPQATSNRELALGVGTDGRAAALKNAVSGCAAFGLTRDEAVTLCRALKKVVAAWPSVFQKAGITKSDANLLATCFERVKEALQ